MIPWITFLSSSALGLGTEFSIHLSSSTQWISHTSWQTTLFLRDGREGRPPECASGEGKSASAGVEWSRGGVWVGARVVTGKCDPMGDCCAGRAEEMCRHRAGAQKTCGSCCCWTPCCQISMEASSVGSVASGSQGLSALLICPLARGCKAQLPQQLITCSAPLPEALQ